MSVVSNQVRCLVTGEETLRFVNLCRNNFPPEADACQHHKKPARSPKSHPALEKKLPWQSSKKDTFSSLFEKNVSEPDFE